GGKARPLQGQVLFVAAQNILQSIGFITDGVMHYFFGFLHTGGKRLFIVLIKRLVEKQSTIFRPPLSRQMEKPD
ncbi:hypothetical protein, partial [Alistipes sp.]|uniref:hypothetical protein n=1 Tax=Alistipes sp. TaxID=1872444 RepID=UPI003AB191DE